MMSEDKDRAARASERVAAVRARFVDGLPRKVEALAELADRAASPDAGAASAAADGLRLGLHNLAGGAPTLGLPDLGAKAAALERRLIAARRPDGSLDPETAGALAAEIMALAELRS